MHEPPAGLRRTVAERVFAFGFRRVTFGDSQDVDHSVDARFQESHDVDDAADALAGEVLKGAGGVGFGRLLIESIANRRVGALLAERPGDFLDALDGGEDFGRRLFRGLDDGVELVAGEADPSLPIFRRLDRGDLRLGAGDRVRHVDEVEAHALGAGNARPLLQAPLQLSDRLQHEPGVGLAVAAHVLGQKPAPARGLQHGAENRLVIGVGHRGWGRIRHGGSKSAKKSAKAV